MQTLPQKQITGDQTIFPFIATLAGFDALL
jgi:hypothetical protein